MNEDLRAAHEPVQGSAVGREHRCFPHPTALDDAVVPDYYNWVMARTAIVHTPLGAALQRQGITVIELARATQISYDHLWRVVAGKRRISAKTRFLCSRALRVDPHTWAGPGHGLSVPMRFPVPVYRTVHPLN